jgi:5-methylcytosine-specific restriction protein A
VYLREHPLCVGYPQGMHGERFEMAKCVDHIVPHKGNVELFWDEKNWQPLCIACNSRKSLEEGGLGLVRN